MRKIILSFAACLALAAYGQKPVQDTRAMDTFIDQLMGKMTLDEKIGQLNLSGGGVPGILSGSEGADETIRRGWLGATGGSELETFRKLQEIAVKESRLGIPLLFGLDVIHGYHTICLLYTSWRLFMSCPEIQDGLKKLGFTIHNARES